jgi:hypothetical protein
MLCFTDRGSCFRSARNAGPRGQYAGTRARDKNVSTAELVLDVKIVALALCGKSDNSKNLALPW